MAGGYTAILCSGDGALVSRCLRATLFALAITWTGLVNARVVGVVLDDSGSMLNRFETPLYALQLIVSVLGENDRLFVTRLSNRGEIKEINLAQREKHLDSMRQYWKVVNNTSTPYAPVEKMLARLVAVAGEGEQASLLVITDGKFEGPPPPPPKQLAKTYRNLRERFQGDSLRSFFVVFAPAGNDKLLKVIREQGVRSNLLGIFNGNENVGNFDVHSGRELYVALREIIAQIVGIDPEAAGDSLVRDHDKLIMQPPFTISRAVVIASGTSRSPPVELLDTDFPVRSSRSYQPAMRKADALTADVFRSNVYDLVPWPPLAAATEHVLLFSRPLVSGDVQLLFETAVKVDWQVFDDTGRELPVDRRGVVRLLTGSTVRIQAYLVEPAKGGNVRVNLHHLAHTPVFSLHHDRQGRSRDSSRMTVNRDDSIATADLSFDKPGTYRVAVSARYPGFINKRARDLTVLVEAVTQVDFDFDTHGLGVCPDCRPDKVDLNYTLLEEFQDLLSINVSSSAQRAADYRLALSDDLPDGVRLLLSDGSTLDRRGATSIRLVPGTPLRLRLQYNSAMQVDASAVATSLTVSAQTPMQGEAALALHLVPRISDLRVSLAGTTLDPSGADPFRVPVTALADGEGLYVKIEGLVAPLEAAHVEIAGDGVPLHVQPQPGTNLLLIVPEVRLCDCITPTGKRQFTLRYQHPVTRQHAQYTGTFEVTPVGVVQRCWQETLLLLALLLLLWKLLCLLRHHRFSRGWHVEKKSIDDEVTVYGREYLWRWYHYLLPWCGDAQRRVFGFNLQATDMHVLLLDKGGVASAGNYIYRGEKLKDLLQAKHGAIRWEWKAAISDGDFTFTLKRNRNT